MSVLPFVVLAAGLSLTSALDQRNRTIEEMAATAETLRLAIERELRMADAILHALASSPALDAALEAGAGAEADLLRAFHEQASRVASHHGSAIVNILLLDAAGTQIINTLRPAGTAIPSDPPRVPPGRTEASGGLPPEQIIPTVVATGETYVTDLVLGPVAARPIVAVQHPIHRGGAVVGVLAANLSPSGFGAVLRAHMPETGYVASIVDRAGVILARTHLEDRFVGSAATDEVQAFVRDASLTAATRPSLTADGEQVQGAFRRLETVPWTIAFGAPRAVIDGPIQRLLFILGLSGVIALGFFVTATLWLGRELAGEMRTLARDAEAIGLGARLPVRRERVREVAEVRAALRAGVASLADAEERMRLAVDGAGMATWDVDVARDQIVWAGHFLEMLGLPADARPPLPAQRWRERVHPDDLPQLMRALEVSAREDTRFHSVYRVSSADGAPRWLESFGSHVFDDGQARFIGVTFDITERHLAEEQRRLLMREVDHRAKNALAVVHSVVRLTRAATVEDYAEAVEGRVRALARAHDLLARDRWAGADLGDIAAQELAAQVQGGQVTLGGPAVRLVPEAVQPLSMVLHELATNATKYGALSVPKGHVDLAWRILTERGDLALRWTERDGPAVTPPSGSGFGSRLIEVTVKGQLGGTATNEWRAEGLVCEIEIPRDRIAAIGGVRDPAARNVPGAEVPPLDSLAGRRILVLEDEAVIAAELAESLRRAGCVPVGPFATVRQALDALARHGRVDGAVLDVNLGAETSLPVVRTLTSARIPVLIATGYSELPTEWQNVTDACTVLRKPVDPDDLLAALCRAMSKAQQAA